MEERLMEILNLPKGSHVLDAGCGVGHVSRFMAQRGHRTLGIDLIDWTTEDVRSAARAAGLDVSQMRVEKMDYHHLDMGDDTMDGVITMQSISHAYDVKKVMAEFYRVTRPGGRIGHGRG
jgi:ubiquinone/menaquinone biosynthesis C-methylase UbiE